MKKRASGFPKMSNCSSKVGWKAPWDVLKTTDKPDMKAEQRNITVRGWNMSHQYNTHFIQNISQSSVSWQANANHRQQMATMSSSKAPDVTAELLDIACQNKFMPFNGLGLPLLHHKLITTHIYSAEKTGHNSIWNSTQRGVCVGGGLRCGVKHCVVVN